MSCSFTSKAVDKVASFDLNCFLEKKKFASRSYYSLTIATKWLKVGNVVLVKQHEMKKNTIGQRITAPGEKQVNKSMTQ